MRIAIRTVRWNPVVAADLKGYNLYYQKVTVEKPKVDYTSPFVYVGNITTVVITDVIPTAVTWDGGYSLGVSAVDNAGNESDIASGTSFFDYTAPPMPTGFVIV
jgi:hypothetical protein